MSSAHQCKWYLRYVRVILDVIATLGLSPWNTVALWPDCVQRYRERAY